MPKKYTFTDLNYNGQSGVGLLISLNQLSINYPFQWIILNLWLKWFIESLLIYLPDESLCECLVVVALYCH